LKSLRAGRKGALRWRTYTLKPRLPTSMTEADPSRRRGRPSRGERPVREPTRLERWHVHGGDGGGASEGLRRGQEAQREGVRGELAWIQAAYRPGRRGACRSSTPTRDVTRSCASTPPDAWSQESILLHMASHSAALGSGARDCRCHLDLGLSVNSDGVYRIRASMSRSMTRIGSRVHRNGFRDAPRADTRLRPGGRDCLSGRSLSYVGFFR